MTEEFVLVPLSVLDQNGVDMSSITFGYILDTTFYDTKKLDGAAERLVEKWRLLAGRLEYDKELKSWCIRVPTGKLDGAKTYKFTSSVLAESLDVPLVYVNATSVEILPRPALKYFRDKSTPNSLGAYSSQKAPIVSIHISRLANCTCIGISVPHSAFDAVGMGQIVAGLDAELNGKPWTAPSISSENIIRRKLEELRAVSPVHEESAALQHVRRDFIAARPLNTAKVAFGLGREYLWHRVKLQSIYLGQKIVDTIVQEAKSHVKAESGDKEFVSTGDILVAWLLKAAHGDEFANDDPVSVTTFLSLRSIFSPSNPAFSTYTHNAIMPCTLPLLTTSSLHTTSIAQLATMHRSAIDAVRTPEFVQSYIPWVSEVGGNLLPDRRTGVHSWIFSNQVIAGLNRIDFGVKQISVWHWNVPIQLDHTCMLNQFDGGYILEAAVRKVRWAAIEREVMRLKEVASKI